MKKSLIIPVVMLVMMHSSVSAITVDLTSGTNGTTYLNQSFNGETRAADVTVLGTTDRNVSSMTVHNVDIRSGTTTVGARIYDNATATLYASANIAPTVADDQTISIPISATLYAGNSYRVGFFIGASGTGNNGDMFDPDPASVGLTQYTESNGYFQVTASYSLAGDVYPTNDNIFIPDRMEIEISEAPMTTEVDIDIKPGSDPNSINLSSAGVIPVAILSSSIFDATTVDPATVSLAGASVKMVGKSDKYLCAQEDVNNDGLIDLVCKVYTADFMIEVGETIAVLEASTFNGEALRGEDHVKIVPDN